MTFAVRLARPDERETVRRFVVANHLNGGCNFTRLATCQTQPSKCVHAVLPSVVLLLAASSYNPRALELQIADLLTDFPDLYDGAIFRGCVHWIATLPDSTTVVGVIGAHEVEGGDVRTANIMHFFVDPSCQRLGCGRALLHTALGHFEALGCARAKLLTLKGVYGGACRLYESVGFRVYEEQDSEAYVLLRYELFFGKEPAPLGPEALTSGPALDAWRAAGPGPWGWPGRAEAIAAAAAVAEAQGGAA